jgi:hypothetical protein
LRFQQPNGFGRPNRDAAESSSGVASPIQSRRTVGGASNLIGKATAPFAKPIATPNVGGGVRRADQRR